MERGPFVFQGRPTGLVRNTLRERLVESLFGIRIVALGVPVFLGRTELDSAAALVALPQNGNQEILAPLDAGGRPRPRHSIATLR